MEFPSEVYLDLFGQEVSDRVVAWESNLRESYEKCWQWALAFKTNERANHLSILREDKENWESYLASIS